MAALGTTTKNTVIKHERVFIKNEEENVESVQVDDAKEDPFLGKDKMGKQFTMDQWTLNLKLEKDPLDDARSIFVHDDASNDKKIENIDNICELNPIEKFTIKYEDEDVIKHERLTIEDENCQELGDLTSQPRRDNMTIQIKLDQDDCIQHIKEDEVRLKKNRARFEEITFDHKKVKTNYSRKNPTQGTKDKYFSCSQCSKTFTEVLLLKQHEEGHINEDNKPYKCNACGGRFALKSSLNRHKAKYDGQDHHPIRQKQFQSDGKLFFCSVCKKSFRWRRSFEKHSHIKHTCKDCNKTYNSRYELKLHETIHTGEKNFECHLCKQKFARKHYLRSHLKSHQRLDPRQGSVSKHGLKAMCEICKTVVSSQGLRQHMKTHVQNRFACNHCDMRFNDEKEFQSHKKKIHAPKSGQKTICEICNCEIWKRGLQNHMKTHVKDRFACEYCAERFDDKISFRKHKYICQKSRKQ